MPKDSKSLEDLLKKQLMAYDWVTEKYGKIFVPDDCENCPVSACSNNPEYSGEEYEERNCPLKEV